MFIYTQLTVQYVLYDTFLLIYMLYKSVQATLLSNKFMFSLSVL